MLKRRIIKPLLVLFAIAIVYRLYNSPLDPTQSTPSSSVPTAKIPTPVSIITLEPAKGGGDTDPQTISRKLFFDSMGVEGRDPARAIRLLTSALEKDPGFESALDRLAKIFFEQGRFDEARENASRCLNVNARDHTCHQTLISSIQAQEGLEAAMPSIQECLTADSRDVFCLGRAREYYLSKGDRQSLGVMLEQAFGSLPDEITRQQRLGLFFQEVGDLDGAKRSFENACDLGSSEACESVEYLKKKSG